MRPRQNGRHFADDIFKCIFLNENVWIPVKIPLKFVPEGPINNIPAMVQIMAWRRPGAMPLSEPMMVSLPTHICVARPQWVKLGQIMTSIYGCIWPWYMITYPWLSTIYQQERGQWLATITQNNTSYLCRNCQKTNKNVMKTWTPFQYKTAFHGI